MPGDQIVRLQAGVKLEDLQEQLSGSDQMLAIDPPESGATIGGIVAANSSGPRRYRYGTIRDLIIGITVVLHDGTVAKAGGKVVKNVAGYDLSKLFTGSLGTLGVIADANFRLHPIPASASTVALEVDRTPSRRRRRRRLYSFPGRGYGGRAALRREREAADGACSRASPGGIDAKAEATSFLLKQFGEVRTLSDEETDRSRAH